MRQLPLDFLNPQLLGIQCALCGKFVEKERAYPDQPKSDSEGNCASLHFNKNIISPDEGLHQPPITFTGQVAALTEWPPLSDLTPGVFSADVVARAKEYYNEIGSIGAYAHNQGVPSIRGSVAKSIEGGESPVHPRSRPRYALLTRAKARSRARAPECSASPVMIMIASFSLFCVTNRTLPRHFAKSFIDIPPDRDGYAASPDDIFLTAGASGGISLLINLLITDPAAGILIPIPKHPNDVHPRLHQFTSFKKVVRDLNSPVPFVSFHSISKGARERGAGPAGIGADCGGQHGEAVVPLFTVRPPKEGEPSYALWKAETDTIRNDLRERTKIMGKRLNEFPSVSCVEGPCTPGGPTEIATCTGNYCGKFRGEKVSVEPCRSLD
ncbi:transaminase [Mycena rebaudengoi]|nr:transaminase [Mycena rebaudengoi]